MSTSPAFRTGCNVIDPMLQVGPGSDYNLPITRRSLEFLAECGVDAVEFSHALHWNDDEVAAVRQMTEEIGLGAWSLHAWGAPGIADEESATATTEMLTRAGQVALGLGAGVIVHHCAGRSLAAHGDDHLKRETDAIRAAWQPGYRFAIENTFDVGQMEYVIALVDELGSDVAGVCVDTGHANLLFAGAEEKLLADRAIRMAGHRLITTHLQDNTGEAHDQHMAPGDGTIDWDAVAEALIDVGYRRCLMLELTDHPTEDREHQIREEIKRGADVARALADRVFA